MVRKIDTAKSGNADIFVPLVQMTSLMGFVVSAINATILGLDMDAAAKQDAIVVFGQLL